MTPEQKAFEAALKERLAERARTILSTEQGVLELLKAAQAQIVELLAAQPGDFAQWRLPQILAQLETLLNAATGRAGAAADAGLRSAWQQGEDFIDKPLAAAGIHVEAQLPLLDAGILVQLRGFTNLRLRDVGTEAAMRIGRQLSLVTIGGQTPFEAMQKVQAELGGESMRRATTIVRTQVGQAFALASEQRLEQAAAKVPGLQKQWRRSGKIHSRWNHDAIDGQVVDASKPFTLPSHHGPIKMMHPHDPTAPAEEVINCGCIALPYKANWKVVTPGARPFTDLELRLDPRKAQLDQAARRAGLRGGQGGS